MSLLKDFNLDSNDLSSSIVDLLSMPEFVLKEILDELEEDGIEKLTDTNSISAAKRQLENNGATVESFEKEIEELKAFKEDRIKGREFDNDQQIRMFDFFINYLYTTLEILKKEGLVIPIKIYISKLHEDAALPLYKHLGDSGCDICILEDTIIPAKTRVVCKSGIAVAIPVGYEIQVRLRSSVALNTPLLIPNSPGTIDSGYRGDVSIILFNTSDEPYEVKKGERIAQLVLSKVERINWEIIDDVVKVGENREGGFGSTGN